MKERIEDLEAIEDSILNLYGDPTIYEAEDI